MKRFVSFLILSLIFLPYLAFSAAGDVLNSAEFDISAFKVGPEQYLKLIITDAINESLGVLGEEATPEDETEDIYKTIDLSRHTDTLIGEPTVIFSYRVVGNTVGRYTVEAEINPFYLSTGSGIDKTKIVNATYSPDYITVVFPETSTTTASDAQIKTESTTEGSFTIDQADEVASLSSTWSVSSSSSEDTVAEWISRGAMKMQLDKVSYDSAGIGTYVADVKVTLRNGN